MNALLLYGYKMKRFAKHLCKVVSLWCSTLTEVCGEDEQCGGVHEQADQLGERHEAVPRHHRQGHHYQLGQDERRVANLHYMDQLLLEKNKRAVHYNATCNTNIPLARKQSQNYLVYANGIILLFASIVT